MDIDDPIIGMRIADTPELAGSRPTAPEPSEVAIEAARNATALGDGGVTVLSRRSTIAALRAAYAVDFPALAGSPQPPAGDPREVIRYLGRYRWGTDLPDEEVERVYGDFLKHMAGRAALRRMPPPVASEDVLGRIASWDIYQTKDGLVQHFVADVRAALRGGSHQPEVSNG